MNRRIFFSTIPALWGLSTISRSASLPTFFQEIDDAELCKKKFDVAVSMKLRSVPIGEAIVGIGQTFLGTPYVANALEVPGDEHLVVNMHGLDCVSFYENALVLARCIKMGKMTFDDYKAQLQLIRYRGGVIDGYPSRLHYTSDYFYDNVKKGIWTDIAQELGGVKFEKTLNFMSTHPDSYRQLKGNPAFLEKIKEQEAEINKRTKYYVPKEKVESISSKLKSGDIIGTATDIEGLDTTHTGIVARDGEVVRFLHAPLSGKQVVLSQNKLHEYLAPLKRVTGILIVRPNEVA